ncbi:MAG: methyl-accepting chemotaxis protein [Bacillota bacterium]|nr:methyl-accepting chemotaxis protein [Bacillota bacterium]
MSKKKNISLRFKISGSFIILILICSIGIGLYAINKAKSTIEEAVGQSGLNIVKSMAGEIDIDKFNKLQNKDDMKSEYYNELHNKLKEMKENVGLKYLYTMRKTQSGKYIYVVDGAAMDSDDFSMLGDEEKETTDKMKVSFDGKTSYELYVSDQWGHLLSSYVPIKDKSGNTVGVIGADFDASAVFDGLNKVKTGIFIVAAIIILLGITVSNGLSFYLVHSLNELKKKALLAEGGDLTVEIESIGNDEIGLLTQAFKIVVDSMASITKNIRRNTKNVLDHTQHLSVRAGETSKVTEEITTVINEIALGSLEQVKSIDDFSKTMEVAFNQIEKAINQADLISRSSTQAMSDTQKAADIFKDSIKKVSIANDTIDSAAEMIQALGESSKEIVSCSDMISQIAKQTNLLALNAAIESARAGEHGKGFAVVADEVRTLADQSSNASKKINDIVNKMQNEIEKAIQSIQDGAIKAREGVDAVTSVDIYLSNVQNSNSEAYSRVREISDANRSVKDLCIVVVDRISKMAEISKEFSAGSQQAAASAEEQLAVIQEMEGSIDTLKQMSYDLEREVNRFKVN